MIRFIVNDTPVETDAPAGTVLLDYLRREARLTGTKEGCKEGECGACTVLLGCAEDGEMVYRNVASCLVPLGDAAGRHVVTIEGVNLPDGKPNPIQAAFIEAGATQCGFCTPGFIMSLTAFFLNSSALSPDDALDAVDGNLCRCTGHIAIRAAITRLCDEYAKRPAKKNRIAQLVSWGILQPWMEGIQKKLPDAEPAAAKPAKESVFVAGGTDAFVQRPDALRRASLYFLSRRPELSFIKEEGDAIVLGGGTTTEKLRRSELLARALPDNKNMMTHISSTIMRNRATVAGNLVNASPIADLAIIFLALGATLDIEAADDTKRSVALADFYKGYKKLDLAPGELVRALRFTKPALFSFEKVSQREYLDIASVNSALQIVVEKKTITRALLSAGGVAPVPSLLRKTADALTGKPLTPATVQAAAKIMEGEIAPIDDVRGSAAYKRMLLRQLLYAHFIKLFPAEFSLEALV